MRVGAIGLGWAVGEAGATNTKYALREEWLGPLGGIRGEARPGWSREGLLWAELGLGRADAGGGAGGHLWAGSAGSGGLGAFAL